MISGNQSPNTGRPCVLYPFHVLTLALVVAAMALSATGCGDQRISIDEFVAMQREIDDRPAAEPTTQPAESRGDIWSRHAFVPYHVGSNDVLAVALTGIEMPTGTTVVQTRIDANGEISLPMAGAVKVGGLTLQDVERAITDRYVPSFIKVLSVNVQVIEYETTDVLVLGAVATPGLLPLPNNERDLLHAVARAGGVSFTASGRITLKRVRRPTEEITLNVLDPAELEAAFALEPLESGDIVEVEAAEPSVVYVVGLVNAPGMKLFTPGTKINLLQLLAASGGVITAVAPKEATLIRRMPNGENVRVKIDLDRLWKDGSYPNITLAAGDIFEVPETAGTKALAWAHQNLFFRAGISVTGGVNASYNASAIDWLNRRDLQKGRFGQSGLGGGGTLQDQFDPFGFFVP